ncbi:hypothetical protein EXN66_Car006812 [Channa argus]|uniref:Uncharacterized protein n=1 Tax=Channa argus TaxID=215402 RepID=A0A6G1PLN2_CHAAH|nr:hypothetical protein EXN66_Car006812 [Channa argus]KAK2907645.1 hypothetical protein Q8A73_008718 [Channa argus]
MARNEEKQQGRLNRLWLQKEREEGRLKDVHERRPKLATLNSISSVKKWIPSIKNEIEYYLQQSQLSHYPERKIAEFKLHIEALEKEYKRFISKLRALDPPCKHKPWTPRAYCKRKPETPDSPSTVKNPRRIDSHEDSSEQCGGGDDLAGNWTLCPTSSGTQKPLKHSENIFQTLVPKSVISETSETACADQDQPLSFDSTRLAVAAAAFRGSSVQVNSLQTQTLSRVLHSGLPNLNNCSSARTFSLQSRGTENNNGTEAGLAIDWDRGVQQHKSACGAAEMIPDTSTNSSTPEKRTCHILGLDCYSSTDEDCDT